MKLDVLMARIQKQLVDAPVNGGMRTLEIVKDSEDEYSLVSDPETNCGHEWRAMDYTAKIDSMNELIKVPATPRILLPDSRSIAIMEWTPSVKFGEAITVSMVGYLQQLKASPNAADSN